MADQDTLSEQRREQGVMSRTEFLHDINVQTTMETPDIDRPDMDEPARKLWVSYLLALPPHGLFGAYHYYLHRRKMAFVFSCSVGIFGLGWFIDLLRMYWLVRRVNRDYAKSLTDPLYLDDVYMVWFPLGLIGAHRFYLGDYREAVFALFTLGGFGLGWLIDGTMLSCHVEFRQDELDTNRGLEHAPGGAARTIEDFGTFTIVDTVNTRMPPLATPLNSVEYTEHSRVNGRRFLHIESFEPPPYPTDHQLPSNGMGQDGQTHVGEMPPPPEYSSISIMDQLPTYDSIYTNDNISYI